MSAHSVHPVRTILCVSTYTFNNGVMVKNEEAGTF